MPMSVVTLTGFMGTGKSTVGRRLAEALRKPFVDTDAVIEARAGMPVAEIFARRGEADFRSLEREVIAETVVQDAVIATGGGAIVDDANFRAMQAAGPIVCLQADAETILLRTGKDRSRPLLNDGEREQRVRSLLEARAAAYSRADLTIDTSQLPVPQVIRRIRAFLKERKSQESQS